MAKACFFDSRFYYYFFNKRLAKKYKFTAERRLGEKYGQVSWNPFIIMRFDLTLDATIIFVWLLTECT